MPDMERQIKDRIEAFIRDISVLARQAVESKLAKATKGKPAKGKGRTAAPAPKARGKRPAKKVAAKKAPPKRGAKAGAGKQATKKARGRKSSKVPAKRARKA